MQKNMLIESDPFALSLSALSLSSFDYDSAFVKAERVIYAGKEIVLIVPFIHGE